MHRSRVQSIPTLCNTEDVKNHTNATTSVLPLVSHIRLGYCDVFSIIKDLVLDHYYPPHKFHILILIYHYIIAGLQSILLYAGGSRAATTFNGLEDFRAKIHV